jgi:hypothetical protein
LRRSAFERVVQVRIICPSDDEVDGVELAQFQVGATYHLDRSLATYLVVMGAAEVVMSDDSAAVTPLTPRAEERVWMGPKSDLAIAADAGAPHPTRKRSVLDDDVHD